MQFLKQSTAATVKIGPFVDDTDGKTAETGLALTQSDIRLAKNGGDLAAKNDAAACTHDELGVYDCPLDATDTATLGRLQLFVHESGALPVWHEFAVLPAAVFDAWFGSDRQQVDVLEIAGTAVAGPDDLKADVSGLSTFDPAADDVSLSETDLDDLKDTIMGSPGGKSVKDAYDKAEAARARVDALVGTPVITDTAVSGVEQGIAIYRGDTAPILFDLDRDITGAALAFTVKRRHSDAQADALITKTSAESSEIAITDAEAGEFEVKLLAADTSGLLPDGRAATFVYDVEMTLDGIVETVAAGDFLLVPDVTTAA